MVNYHENSLNRTFMELKPNLNGSITTTKKVLIEPLWN